MKVGFYGLTTARHPGRPRPGEITFARRGRDRAGEAGELKEQGADFVVAVVHSGILVDMELAREGLADLVLVGPRRASDGLLQRQTALTESESQGNYVVVTTITIDKTEKDGKVT